MGSAAAIVGGSVIGGLASKSAADKQASATKKAADQQAQAAAQMRQDLQPYADLGKSAINPLWAAMGYTSQVDQNAVDQAANTLKILQDKKAANGWSGQIDVAIQDAQDALDKAKAGTQVLDPNATLNQKFSFNADDLENTPGYQFALTQGLKSTNNALAAQGLGLSGAQAKGLSSYATGLADQTYGDQYNRALSTFSTNVGLAQNNVGNLQNLVNLGQNSAAQQGQGSINAANNIGNYQVQGGNAAASGIAGIGNAVNNGINNYMLYNALYGK